MAAAPEQHVGACKPERTAASIDPAFNPQSVQSPANTELL